MEFKEFGQIAKALKTFYPKDGLLKTNEELMLWYEHLKDIDYSVLSLAVNKWVDTNKWSPTIADLRELVNSITGNEVPDISKAWEEVQTAIKHYGYTHPKRALESMTPITRRVVESMGFIELCSSENQIADRAHFMEMYKTLAKREKDNLQTPISARVRLEELQNKYRIGG